MSDHYIDTINGWSWCNIFEIWGGSELPRIIYNQQNTIKTKGWICILTEGKKLPEATHIVGFINSTQSRKTHKLPNLIFEEHEGNCVFVCAKK